MCSICNAGTQHASVPAMVVYTDCHPAMMAGFAGSEDPFVFAVSSSVHSVHKYKEYVERM